MLKKYTIRASFFSLFIALNCFILIRTALSIGLFDASPFSLSHGCSSSYIMMRTTMIVQLVSYIELSPKQDSPNNCLLRNSKPQCASRYLFSESLHRIRKLYDVCLLYAWLIICLLIGILNHDRTLEASLNTCGMV